MQPNSPLACYHQALAAGEYQADSIQLKTITQLDNIYQQLSYSITKPPSSWLRKQLNRFSVKPHPNAAQTIKGLYMWGGVGRGKTWLMDIFFNSLPGERKLRLHFHRFMLRVHEELAELQGQEDPLQIVADGFKAQADILCFDEFFVSDITDAMLLATLLKALFAHGIILVATSNIPPAQLYRNGLQRARFLPAIDLILQHCDVVNVDAGIDYRLRTLTQAHLYLTPIDDTTDAIMEKIFNRLTGKKGLTAKTLQINHRPMQAIREDDGVLAIDFQVLCADARSQMDYIALAQLYHSVILHNVKIMSEFNEDTARRFIALVDEFYERHVKLIISAEVPMQELYQGELLNFEYQRCLSRLQEMQSEEYLKLPHLP